MRALLTWLRRLFSHDSGRDGQLASDPQVLTDAKQVRKRIRHETEVREAIDVALLEYRDRLLNDLRRPK